MLQRRRPTTAAANAHILHSIGTIMHSRLYRRRNEITGSETVVIIRKLATTLVLLRAGRWGGGECWIAARNGNAEKRPQKGSSPSHDNSGSHHTTAAEKAYQVGYLYYSDNGRKERRLEEEHRQQQQWNSYLCRSLRMERKAPHYVSRGRKCCASLRGSGTSAEM